MGKANAKRDLPQRQVSKDWAPFAQNLAQVLARLEEDQFLILSAKQGNRYLQFSCQGAWGMRAEVASNHFLEGDDRLTRREMAWLRAHGWLVPTGTPVRATPDNDPDGSPNYYRDFLASATASDIASMAIDTLIHGIGLPHPGALSYESFDADRGALAFQELGLNRSARRDIPLMDQVLSAFQNVTGIADLAYDEDGDVSVCYGSIVISAVQLNNRVRLFSGLISEVEPTPGLLPS